MKYTEENKLELNTRLRAQTVAKKVELFQKITENAPMTVVRNFLVIDTRLNKLDSPTIIVQLPSLQCHGFSLDITKALELLQDESGDRDLINVI